MVKESREAGKPRAMFTLVVDHQSPMLGEFDACTLDQPKPGELGRLRCKDGAVTLGISIVRAGNDIVAKADTGKELARVSIPAAQRVAPVTVGN